MTENEAVILLSQMYLPNFDEEEKQALSKAIEALQEIHQYRAIGTVEECWEARERQIPKKPIRVDVGHNGSSTDGCPVCKREFYEKFNFCPDCGTALGWNE